MNSGSARRRYDWTLKADGKPDAQGRRYAMKCSGVYLRAWARGHLHGRSVRMVGWWSVSDIDDGKALLVTTDRAARTGQPTIGDVPTAGSSRTQWPSPAAGYRPVPAPRRFPAPRWSGTKSWLRWWSHPGSHPP